MTNYDITPVGSSTPLVRLYGDSMQPVRRGQVHEAQPYAVQEGAPPGSVTTGLEPGITVFQGIWLGADASALGDRLRTLLNDPTVETVTVDAVDDAGTSISSPLDGDYRIAERNDATKADPADDAGVAWRYKLTLIEL